ncbi:MAG: DUF2931 family protein [Sulfuricurvum sp.]|uniref:DUF2931 family protein n=1 Tax=Sulfuricurvum sp. TaxID=2025608 RepID=UPI002630D945|nr:DUF2931 family protein [Sulfuricurvum sp.]MDD5161118.1 DUF2931 family protein [Sulfuricurvum sp.]
MRLRNLLLYMSILFAITGCSNHQTLGDIMSGKPKVTFETSISAPKGYPVELVDGYCGYFNESGKPTGGFFGSASMGWDEFGSVGTSTVYGFPKRVRLRWLSLAENQFYELDAELPMEKMRQLYAQGYRSPVKTTHYIGNGVSEDISIGQWRPFTGFTFMMAPGGSVVVKLIGREARELAYFQAKKTDMPWHDFQNVPKERVGDRNEWVKKMYDITAKEYPIGYAQVMNKQIPYGLWDDVYRRRYPWHVSTTSPLAYREYNVEYLNTERFMIWGDQVDQDLLLADRPAPAKLKVFFKDADGRRLRGFLRFDEVSVAKAFGEFFKYSKEPARLQIETSDDLKTVEVKLINASHSMVIPYTFWRLQLLDGDGWDVDNSDHARALSTTYPKPVRDDSILQDKK